MIGKLNIGETRFKNPYVTPAPEQEKKSTKLSRLDPQELIPAKLSNIPEIIGSMKIAAHKSDGSIDYVITDNGRMTLRQIEKGFKYLYYKQLEEYPEIKIGKNLYARPLVHGSISEISPDMLFGGMFETNPVLRGKGAGVAFQEHMADLAKELGYRFLAGYQNDAEIARFFLKRDRYILEEIKDERQAEFQSLRDQENDDTVFYTVKFLRAEDIAQYVRPERIGTDVEDKIEFKQKIQTLGDVFSRLAKALEKVEEGKEAAGDRATLIEIMEDLNQMLSAKDRYDLPELAEDDDNLVIKLKVLLEHLKSKSSKLIREATLEQLEENIV